MKKLVFLFALFCGLASAQNTFIPQGGILVKTASYTAQAADVGKLIQMNCASCTLTLPTPPPYPQWTISVANLNASTLTIAAGSTQIDGAIGSIFLSQNTGYIITTDGNVYATLRGGASAGALPPSIPNCTPGTSLNNLLQLSVQGGQACVTTATANSTTTIGVCSGGCGTTGSGQITSTNGFPACVFDGVSTVNDYVAPSSTPGLCHDIGTSIPTSSGTQVIGVVKTAAGGLGSTGQIIWGVGTITTGGSGGSGIVNPASIPLPLGYYATAGTAISPNSGATASATGDIISKSYTSNGAGTGSVLSPLIEGVAHPDQFTGSDPGAKLLAAATQLVTQGGGTIDARNMTGTQTMTTCPFTGINVPITLYTGKATWTFDPGSISCDVPSHFRLVAEGTTFTVSTTNSLAYVDTNGQGISGQAWILPRDFGTTASTTNGSASVTVGSAANLEVGMVVGICCIQTISNSYQTTTLTTGGGINASATTFTVNNAVGWGANASRGDNYILIDSEILKCTSMTTTTFSGCTRAQFGTTAASHAQNANIFQEYNFYSQITAISGNTLTLTDNAPATASGLIFDAGAIDVSIQGNATFDGSPSRTTGLNGFSCFACSRVTIDQAIKFVNWGFAAVQVFGMRDSVIGGHYFNNGNVSAHTGADIFMIGGNTHNRVETVEHILGNEMIIDGDRSTSSIRWDAPPSNNSIALGPAEPTTPPNTYAVGIELDSASYDTVWCPPRMNVTAGNAVGVYLYGAVRGGDGVTPNGNNHNTVYCGSINAGRGIYFVYGANPSAVTNNMVYAGTVIGSTADVSFNDFQPNTTDVVQYVNSSGIPIYAQNSLASGSGAGWKFLTIGNNNGGFRVNSSGLFHDGSAQIGTAPDTFLSNARTYSRANQTNSLIGPPGIGFFSGQAAIALWGDQAATFGGGNQVAYGTVGTCKFTNDAATDKCFAGWFKAGATSNSLSEVATHLETADGGSSPKLIDGVANSATVYQLDGSGNIYYLNADYTLPGDTSTHIIGTSGRNILSWTLPPSTAITQPFSCHLWYSQATAAVADQFFFRALSFAPTNVAVNAKVYTSATALTVGNVTALASSTDTSIVTFTPSVTGTVFVADIDGFIENPSNASTQTIQIEAQQSNASDLLTIKRGSYCKIY